MVVHFQSIEIELWCGIISIESTGCLIINSQNPFKNFIKPYFDAPQYAWVELFIHDLSITRHFRTIIYFLLRMKENGPPQQKDNNHDEDQEDQDDDEEDQDEEVDDDEDEEDENDDKDKRKKKHKTKEETKEKRNKRSTLFES